MKPRFLLPAALLAAAATSAPAGARVGIGLNFGFPLYDSPVPSTVIVVPQPAETEVIPAAPGPDYVWIKGRWEWDAPNRRWVWYRGAWQRPPAPGAVWQSGYWSQVGASWSWVGSHWAVPAAPAAPANNPPPAPVAAPAAPVPEAASQKLEVAEAPPAPITEEVYAAPGPDFAWIPGQWTWNRVWIWIPGHYVRRPHPGAVWVAGAWGRSAHGWTWIGGHWR